MVDLSGVANPLEDDWWLLEEYASGLVIGRLSQDVRTDEEVTLFAMTELTGVDLLFVGDMHRIWNMYYVNSP